MPYKPRQDGHSYKALDVGEERIRVSGSCNKPIWFVKISNELCGGDNKHRAPYQWEKKHLLTWRNTYGEIPKGMRIIFLNGDTLDCRLENLYMASGGAAMMMTKYGWFSSEPELTKTAIMCCELELMTRKGQKNG